MPQQRHQAVLAAILDEIRITKVVQMEVVRRRSKTASEMGLLREELDRSADVLTEITVAEQEIQKEYQARRQEAEDEANPIVKSTKTAALAPLLREGQTRRKQLRIARYQEAQRCLRVIESRIRVAEHEQHLAAAQLSDWHQVCVDNHSACPES